MGEKTGGMGEQNGKGRVSVKIKYVLPLAQMTLAVALIWQSQVWLMERQHHGSDMPGPAPHFTLLFAINAPVFYPRVLWFPVVYHLRPYVAYYLDMTILVTMIGLLWFWVALNIIAWRARRAVQMFSWAPLRLGCDAILTFYGLWFGVVCVWDTVAPRIGLYGPYGLRNLDLDWRWQPSLMAAVTVLLLAWCVGLTYFFGRDFVHCILRKRPTVR